MTTITPTRATPDTGGAPNLIRRHPLVAFAVLACGLSWLAWLPYILSPHGLGVWDVHVPEMLGSAQLAGVLPGASSARSVRRSWSPRSPTAAPDSAPGSAGSGSGGSRWQLVRARARRGAARGGGRRGDRSSGGGRQRRRRCWRSPRSSRRCSLQMVTTGLAEEPGWRDFALPRLQPASARSAPRPSSVRSGRCGTCRSSSATGAGGPTRTGPSRWCSPSSCISFNVVMAWVFNRTGQSLPLSMLLHVGVNNIVSIALDRRCSRASTVAATLLAQAVVAAVAAVVLLIATRGRSATTGRRDRAG